ncbi:MAG: hypothetical protein Q9194_000591 [Teloschistes cf. exilis]
MDPTYPPSDQSDILDYTPEGCYTEGYNGRAVGFRQDQVNSTTMTTESCLRACKSQNFPLAATEYGGECYCGVVLGNGTASAPDSDCSMKCNDQHFADQHSADQHFADQHFTDQHFSNYNFSATHHEAFDD